jgi:Protein of unknown function (DUF3124)
MKTLSRVFWVIGVMTLGFSLVAGGAAAEVKLVKGQTLYVPSPTSFVAGTHSFFVRATVYIHNTDPTNAINITGIDFYNSGGKLVEKSVTEPVQLKALAATRINVRQPLEGEDGMAAHFVIKWQSEQKVVEPIIDGWFTGVSGTRGFSFTTYPRIIQEEAN